MVDLRGYRCRGNTYGGGLTISGVGGSLGSTLVTAGVAGGIYNINHRDNFSWKGWGIAEGSAVAASTISLGAEAINGVVKPTATFSEAEGTSLRGLISESNDSEDASSSEHEAKPKEDSNVRRNSIRTFSSGIGQLGNLAPGSNNNNQGNQNANENSANDVYNGQPTQLNQESPQNMMQHTNEESHVNPHPQQNTHVNKTDKANWSQIRFTENQFNLDGKPKNRKQVKPGKQHLKKYKFWLIKSN